MSDDSDAKDKLRRGGSGSEYLRRLILLLWTATVVSGQTPRAEIGVQLSGIRETVFGEYPVGGGGRVTVHAFHFVDAEAEINRYPIGSSGILFPATGAAFGARVGRRWGPIGLYGTLKPGFMRFDANARIPNLGTRPMLQWGGVIELYSRRHVAARFDLGDAVVWYGNVVVPPISAPGTGTIAGTRNQLQWSLGASLWF